MFIILFHESDPRSPREGSPRGACPHEENPFKEGPHDVGVTEQMMKAGVLHIP